MDFIRSFVSFPHTNGIIRQTCCIPLVVHQDPQLLSCRAGSVYQLFLRLTRRPDAKRCSGRGKPGPSAVTEEQGEGPVFPPLIWTLFPWWSVQAAGQHNTCASDTPVITSMLPNPAPAILPGAHLPDLSQVWIHNRPGESRSSDCPVRLHLIIAISSSIA